jgi:tight adherence protein B
MGIGVVATLGALAGAGISGLLAWGRAQRTPEATTTNRAVVGSQGSRGISRRLVLGVAVGALVGAATGWPIAVIVGAVAAAAVVRAFEGSNHRDHVRRIEAVATWTELLRDSLVASAGLAQAVVGCARVAPRELRAEVTRLADRISAGMPMSDALRGFADDVDDASADLVVCALVLASDARTQRLGDLLTALADSIRDEVSMRLRVEAGRASARSSVRTIVVFSIGFAVLLAFLARGYLQPFQSATGQLVLVGVAALYGSGIWLMARLVRPASPVRLLRVGADR